MGGQTSNNAPDNSNFNMEEYNKRVADSGLYNNQPLSQAAINYNQHSANVRPITENVVNKVSLDFSLTKNSLRIGSVTDSEIRVSMKIKARRAGNLRIYLLAIQTPQYTTGDYQLFDTLSPGEELQVQKTFHLNKGVKCHNFPQKYQKDMYPLLVYIGDEEQSLTTYARTINKMKQTVVIKQKLFTQGKEFFIKEVYGLAKESSERLCVICLSEPSDIIVNPCGHMTLCVQCVGELMKSSEVCPICRGKIQSYQHVTEQ